jgi:hypothetical protein
VRILELPHPSTLVPVEADTRSVNLRVLVTGASSDDLLQRIHDDLSKKLPEDERTLDLTLANEPSITYLPIRLGDAGGWKTRVHFYGFRDDTRLLDHLLDYSGDVDGVLIASGEKKGIDTLSRKLAARLKSAKADYPTVVFGKNEAAKQWTAASGLAVADVVSKGAGHEMEAVKALAGQILHRLKKA